MRSRFLFPNYFKILGWVLALPGLVLGYFRLNNGFSEGAAGNFTNELTLAMVVLGIGFIAFSREKHEDELTTKIRYNALYWAVLINYSVYCIQMITSIIRNRFFWDFHHILGEFGNMIVVSMYNLFTPLVVFLLRYYYLLYSKKDKFKVDKVFYLDYKPFKFIGKYVSISLLLIILLTSLIKPAINENTDYTKYNFDLYIFLPLSLLLWAYSREKNEDEFITALRLDSMQLAVYFNYAVLLMANFFLFRGGFMFFMLINLITILVFFLIRFYYVRGKLNKELQVEGLHHEK